MTASMARRWILSLGLLAGSIAAAPIGHCAETVKSVDPGSAEDVQDVLFFGDSRPVLIRLHLLVDGKPYATRWTEHLTRWFRFLDRDEDGFLLRDEVARCPSVTVLQQLFINPYFFQNGTAPTLEGLDGDRDKKVSLAEFLRFYRQSAAGPVQMAPPIIPFVPGVRQDTLTEMLFTLLDADKDGKLSQAEINAAESVLRKYDGDDDELLTIAELTPGGAAATFARVPQPLVPATQAPAFSLLLVPREEAPRRIAARLRVAKDVLTRYDKNKNGSLSRDEIGFPAELFYQLDANKNGELDPVELLRWVLVTPDVEAVLHLGRAEGHRDPLEVIGNTNPVLRKMGGTSLTFSTEESRIHLIARMSGPVAQVQPIRQALVQQFKAIDQSSKGYLTRKQLMMPQFVSLRSILGVADRDDDDCLSLDELNAWVDLTAGGMNCQTTVALTSSGRGLFQILDADQDGRLCTRELRNAWTRLAPYDRGKDRAVARKDIPLQYQIAVNLGAPNYVSNQLNGFPQPGAKPASRRGPLWFHKMDRNGDGDISPSEFLGSREDFRRLDADGDGLISLDEALRADAALRKK